MGGRKTARSARWENIARGLYRFPIQPAIDARIVDADFHIAGSDFRARYRALSRRRRRQDARDGPLAAAGR